MPLPRLKYKSRRKWISMLEFLSEPPLNILAFTVHKMFCWHWLLSLIVFFFRSRLQQTPGRSQLDSI